jgi:hypothetical protein
MSVSSPLLPQQIYVVRHSEKLADSPAGGPASLSTWSRSAQRTRVLTAAKPKRSIVKILATEATTNSSRTRRKGKRQYTDITMPIRSSVVYPDQRLVPSGYGDWGPTVTAPAGGISSAVVDMARILAALNLTAADNPLLAPSEIESMFQAATATVTLPNGNVSGMRGHGWDYCTSEPGNGWYAQKGGSLAGDQSCVRHSTNDISMAVAWGHSIVDGDWYPDFPEVITPAIAQNWGTTDLFPTFGMPGLK